MTTDRALEPAPGPENDAADYYLGRPGNRGDGTEWIGSTDRLGDLGMMSDAGILAAADVVRGATADSWRETVEGVLTDLASGIYDDDQERAGLPVVALPADAYDRLVGPGDEGYRAGWPHGCTTSIATPWAYCYESASVYVYRRGILYATVHLNRARGGYGTPAPFPTMGVPL